MAEKKSKKAASAPARQAAAPAVARGAGLPSGDPGLTLASLRENKGARPKRTRVGRGHGSGMVKTGGEGGKGQTVRSGGGKGPAFEGGQTPWARRLPHRRGYSQKARDIGHFRSTFAVVNLSALASWDPSVEVSPESLIAKKLVTKAPDGIKILGGNKAGATLPQGLRFRDVAFSASAREALGAAGANLGDDAAAAPEA
jgi:large subunit ribosomal protein L15